MVSKNIIKEFLWRKYLFEISLIYGKEYLKSKTHLTWVEWKFNRKVKRMSSKDWIEAAKLYRYYLQLIEEVENENEHTKTNKETEDSGSSA